MAMARRSPGGSPREAPARTAARRGGGRAPRSCTLVGRLTR